MKDTIQLVEWQDRYAQDFIRLSEAWLTKYVSIEPADIEILYHPYESVLDRGGMIFFALAGAQAVGTVAVIPCGGNAAELAKLAVAESHQGQGIGRALIERAIAFARSGGCETLLLYTNRRLHAAIHLYQALHFQEVPLSDNKYLESDMKMALSLRKG